jgi:addiction module RelB/DinJ family antitoxin
MPNNATIQVRVDAKAKARAEKIFKRCGMTTSDAVRIFINQAVEEKGMPFRPRVPDASMPNRRYALSAVLDSFAPAGTYGEVDFGEPQGEEIW